MRIRAVQRRIRTRRRSLLREYDPSQRYSIKAITGKRVVAHKDGSTTLEYKVNWLGWPSSADTWRPHASLFDVQELIEAYERRTGGDNVGSLSSESRDVPRLPSSPAAAQRRHFRTRPRDTQSTDAAAQDSPSTAAPHPGTRAARRSSRLQQQHTQTVSALVAESAFSVVALVERLSGY